MRLQTLSIVALLASIAVAQPGNLGLMLAPIREQAKLPSVAAIVLMRGQIAAIGADGLRANGSPDRVTPDDQFHIGSNTKAMTATVCAMLIEQGKLRWDSTLAEVFPEVSEAMNPAFRTVPLEWLLQNRGGVPGTLTPEMLKELRSRSGDLVAARQYLMLETLKGEPAAPPGTKFLYSNAGYVIAGHMAEHVAGKPWEQLVKEMLFEPLKMDSAGFGPPGSVDRLDQPRGHSGSGTPVAPGPNADNPAAIGPAGTVHCSLADYAKFLALHLKHEPKLLKDETIDRLHTPPEGQQYAMGWAAAQRPWAGGTALTHAGSNTMWFLVVWVAPQRDFAVVVATNIGPPTARKACDEAAGALIKQYLNPDAP